MVRQHSAFSASCRSHIKCQATEGPQQEHNSDSNENGQCVQNHFGTPGSPIDFLCGATNRQKRTKGLQPTRNVFAVVEFESHVISLFAVSNAPAADIRQGGKITSDTPKKQIRIVDDNSSICTTVARVLVDEKLRTSGRELQFRSGRAKQKVLSWWQHFMRVDRLQD
jgi:hypothetical protein